MKPFVKYLFILLGVILFIALLLQLNKDHFDNPENPVRIPTYEEVVPKDFSVDELRRVLDPRDIGPLMQPRLVVVKIADEVIAIACPVHNLECYKRALVNWQRLAIRHEQVVEERAHIVSPEETLLLREGTDITSSILLSALLRAEGFDTRVGITPYSAFVEVQGKTPQRIDMGCANCGLGRIRYQGPESTILWVE